MIIRKNNKTLLNTNYKLIEYLINKLDCHNKKIIKEKEIYNTISSLQEFISYKEKYLKIFDEISEDLKQSSFCINGLLTENKNLIEKNNKLFSIINNNNNKKNNNNINIIQNENNDKQVKTDEFEYLINETSNINSTNINNISNNFSNISNELTLNNDESLKNNKNLKLNSYKNIYKNLIKDKTNKYFKEEKILSKSFNSSDNYKKIYNDKNLSTKKQKKELKKKILLKIFSNADYINLLNKKIGKDFMEKLINKNYDYNYLKNIENIILLNDKNKENNIKKNNSKSIEKKRNLSSFKLNNKRFEESLRDYLSTNNNIKKPQKFNNYTKLYIKYFDNNLSNN